MLTLVCMEQKKLNYKKKTVIDRHQETEHNVINAVQSEVYYE